MQFKAKLVSWNEIETWCDSIREKVSLAFKPDAIVGISRGKGWNNNQAMRPLSALFPLGSRFRNSPGSLHYRKDMFQYIVSNIKIRPRFLCRGD